MTKSPDYPEVGLLGSLVSLSNLEPGKLALSSLQATASGTADLRLAVSATRTLIRNAQSLSFIMTSAPHQRGLSLPRACSVWVSTQSHAMTRIILCERGRDLPNLRGSTHRALQQRDTPLPWRCEREKR